MATILARRVAVEFSDSDDCPSDSEYDSDDWGEKMRNLYHNDTRDLFICNSYFRRNRCLTKAGEQVNRLIASKIN